MAMKVKVHFSQVQSKLKTNSEPWPKILYVLDFSNVCLGSNFGYIKSLGNCVFEILWNHTQKKVISTLLLKD